ncbi:hypothetical protein AB0T83_07625 [Fluviibacterium sp. DFM31]|uniref:Uncharacterized protein n=1 Tax=Meridianimarinicoccus marinus TaxID=3231483 RepID=A0ABV3L543_9RHOB
MRQDREAYDLPPGAPRPSALSQAVGFGAPEAVLTAGDTVELQGHFRVADGYFAADHTSFWDAKIG